MFDISFVIFLFFFSALCLTEFIVFNEEILLALCFFCFVFFCFNTLSDSVYDSFNSRALKFESDLLSSYSNRRISLLEKFSNALKFRAFNFKFTLLFSSFRAYLLQAKSFSSNQMLLSFGLTASTYLSDLISVESKLFDSFQKNCIELLLYPLIFENIGSSLFQVSNFATSSFSNQTSLLKGFSY